MPPPEAWVISRVCESFGCLPSEAVRELRRAPELVADVLEMRAYVQTREALLHAKDEAGAPKGPMADLVADIEYDAMQARKRGEDEEEPGDE